VLSGTDEIVERVPDLVEHPSRQRNRAREREPHRDQTDNPA
jgi:hypothetical protein